MLATFIPLTYGINLIKSLLTQKFYPYCFGFLNLGCSDADSRRCLCEAKHNLTYKGYVRGQLCMELIKLHIGL